MSGTSNTTTLTRQPGQLSSRQLLDVQLAAERLGTPERFVRRLVAERRIRFYKIGKYVRFDAADLDDFVRAVRVETSPTSATSVES